MPLKTGSSRKAVSSNIRELVDTYKSKGRIGTSQPADKKSAVKQAIAISMNQAGMSKMSKGGESRGAAMAEGRRGFQSSPPEKTGVSVTTRKQVSAIRKKGGTVTYKRDGKLPVGVY